MEILATLQPCEFLYVVAQVDGCLKSLTNSNLEDIYFILVVPCCCNILFELTSFCASDGGHSQPVKRAANRCCSEALHVAGTFVKLYLHLCFSEYTSRKWTWAQSVGDGDSETQRSQLL